MKIKILFLFILVLVSSRVYAQNTPYNVTNSGHSLSTFTNFSMLNKNTNIPTYTHSYNEYIGVTKDPIVKTALDLMAGTLGETSRLAILGNNISGMPIEITFRNLSKILPRYKYFDGMGWRKENGQLCIFINEKHKNAPPEAIASLLSNLALHQDDIDSLDEETYAWTMEGAVWLQMKKRNPQLDQLDKIKYPLVYRADKIGQMFSSANYTSKLIRQTVEKHPSYLNLPKRSPGFEDDN